MLKLFYFQVDPFLSNGLVFFVIPFLNIPFIFPHKRSNLHEFVPSLSGTFFSFHNFTICRVLIEIVFNQVSKNQNQSITATNHNKG